MTKRPAKPKPRRARLVVPFSDSVGKTLRRRRLELGLKLENITAETRINVAYLKAIEQSKYEELPHTVHTIGFVHRYARTVGLDGKVATQKYLLERGPLPSAQPVHPSKKLKSPIVGSRLVIVGLVSILMISVIGYLLWQLRILAAPPQLTIDQPANNSAVAGGSVMVRGFTTPGANITVNGQAVYVDDTGHFETTLNLPTGLDQITVTAQNSRHQTNQTTRTVFVQPTP